MKLSSCWQCDWSAGWLFLPPVSAAAEAIIKAQHFLRRHFFNRTANNVCWKGGGSNMYIKRVRLSSPTKESPARTKDNIWERIQTHLPVPSVPLKSDIVAAWMSSSDVQLLAWQFLGATKRKECFFNDGQVDTLILKHVLGNGHTCITDTVYYYHCRGSISSCDGNIKLHYAFLPICRYVSCVTLLGDKCP